LGYITQTLKGKIMKILEIKSSILGTNSTSTKYADKLVQLLKNNDDTVVVRDVAEKPVTQLSGLVLGQLQDPNSGVSLEHNALIEEIKNSDTIVIAAPMYNFSIPATLKNYFDAITKAGVTFKYEATGPVGLIQNKKAYVVISRGGKYKEAGLTFQEEHIKMQLGFIGITNAKFIFVEGLAMGVSAEEAEESFQNQFKKLFV
jgi:FMN-dependent NADH-azoreductase